MRSKTAQSVKEIEYTQCFVAFVDLLGFSALVKDSCEDEGTLTTLVEALNRIALDTPQSTFSKAKRGNGGELLGHETAVLQVRPFSDCICMFVPVAPKRLAWLLRSIRYIHDRMLELGICIRGAITIGDMYWDHVWGATPPPFQRELMDAQFQRFGQEPSSALPNESPKEDIYNANAGGFPITLGPGLVEAHDLETKEAVYPRVIASQSLAGYLSDHGGEKAFPLVSPSGDDASLTVPEFFRTSNDDIPFLDVLHKRIDREDTERIVRETNDDRTVTTRWERQTRSQKEIVELAHSLAVAKLQGAFPDKVMLKYKWLKDYAQGYLPGADSGETP